jgi:predicted nucleic acid-binding Zn ribbon protein
MKCPECGAQASEQDLFCGECGAILAPARPDTPGEAPTADLSVEVLPSEPSFASPSYGAAARDSRANVAFILGIVSVGSVILSCLPVVSLLSCFGPIAGIAAIILGAIVKRGIQARGGLPEDRKRAHQGMILGIAGMAIYLVMIVLGFLLSIGISLLGNL